MQVQEEVCHGTGDRALLAILLLPICLLSVVEIELQMQVEDC